MRGLPTVLIAVLWFSAPAAAADAAPVRDHAADLADELKQAASGLGSAFLADGEKPERLWTGTSVRVVDRDEARQIIAREYVDHFTNQTWSWELPVEEIWGPLYLTGLIPADCNPRRASLGWLFLNDAAVYDWNSRTVLVVNDADASFLEPMTRNRVIMEEFSNALVQQHVFGGKSLRDLDESADYQHDSRLAIWAVVEGAAQLFADRYQSEFSRTHKNDRAAVLQYSDCEKARLKQFAKLPLYFKLGMGTTVCGMRFLMRGKPVSAIDEGETGHEALLELRKRLPQTTEQILHPEKFFDKKAADLPIIVDAGSVERNLGMFTSHPLFTRPRWMEVGLYKDTLGELLCSLMAKPKDEKADPLAALNPSFYTNEAGTGWGGDKFFLLRRGDLEHMKPDGPPPAPEKVKGVWVTAWDTPKDRTEFVDAYSKSNMPAETGVVLLGSRTVVFLFNMTPQERDEVTRLIQKDPPKLKQGGRTVDL